MNPMSTPTPPRYRRAVAGLAAALTLLALAGPALGQPDDIGAAPPAFQPWIPIVLAVFLVIWAAAISFMSSRRGHRD